MIEINLESHNLVQNIPHESTSGGPSTQRAILNVNIRSTEIPFPFIYLFRYFVFTISGLPRLGGGGGGGGGGGKSHITRVARLNFLTIQHPVYKRLSGLLYNVKETKYSIRKTFLLIGKNKHSP